MEEAAWLVLERLRPTKLDDWEAVSGGPMVPLVDRDMEVMLPED